MRNISLIHGIGRWGNIAVDITGDMIRDTNFFDFYIFSFKKVK